MDEIIQKLLESEFLSEEVKSQVKEKFTEYVQNLRESVETEVRAELAEQWTKDREKLVESIDTTVEKFLNEELTELQEDIARFRDLEAEFAERVVEEKRQLGEKVKSEMDTLIEKLDVFIETQIAEEFETLREDIEEAKKLNFGSKVFEAFKTEFTKFMEQDEASVAAKAKVLESKLADAQSQIAILEEEKIGAEREAMLEKVLAPLTGSKRDQMSIILENVSIDNLQDTYNRFIGKVLNESKETIVEDQKTEVMVGDNKTERQTLTESAGEVSDFAQRIKRLAGVN